MIKINLAPVDELESPFYFVPELVVLIVVSVAGYMGVDHHLGNIRAQIEEQQEIEATKKAAIAKLKADLDKFANLNDDITALRKRLDALKQITVSRISKYKPVIVLEHLQNLKPEGVWYTNFTNQGESVTLQGVAFDNILIAEYLMALRSTEAQIPDAADLRTQVYFTNIDLAYSRLGGDPDFAELKEYPTWEISMNFAEKKAPEPEANTVSMSDRDGREVF